jgi:N-methylhydantoinase B
MTRVDPVTFEVIWHRILQTTEEMGIKYMRTSGSPVLVGAYDASTGIALPNGELVAMGPYITTQAHVLNLIINAVLKSRSSAPGIRHGDMYICNDPYLGATHQPDVATVAPAFHGGELRAWVGSSGHWLDIGGPEPGGFNMNAHSVFDEGLRLPPTRLVEEGQVRPDLLELIMAQVRDPLVELDLRGQVVSNEVGIQRMAEMFEQFGADTVQLVMEGMLDHVEKKIRTRLRALPNGVWREVQYLDHDGHETNVRQIVCTLTKQGDRLTVDFTGSAAQVEGFANCARGGLRAAVLSAACILLGYDLPWNDGVSRCIDIVAPSRTIVTAEYPTPVSMSTISAIIVTLNLVFAALSQMLLSSPEHHEEAMATWCGTSLGISMLSTTPDGQLSVAPEASHFAAGCGARSYADGVDTGGIIINTTANIPSIEATEAEYPLLYLFRRQLVDSGGPGHWRGGMSAGVALVPHGTDGPLQTSFSGVGAETPNAFGIGGGLPGAAARFLRFPTADIPGLLQEGSPLPADLTDIRGVAQIASINTSRISFTHQTVEYHNWQGGGGFGDPLLRDPQRVRADVTDRRVTRTAARQIYGVVLKGDDLTSLQVDDEQTSQTRTAIRAERIRRGIPAKDAALPPERLDGIAGMSEAGGASAGRLRVGATVMIDFDSNTATCQGCGHVVAGAYDDPRRGCLVEFASVAVAGPCRGQDYGESNVALAQYYCPKCALQIDSDVLYCDLARHDGYLPLARLFSPGEVPETS